MWLSLVEHLLREQGVVGSNPAIPTTQEKRQERNLGFRSRFLFLWGFLGMGRRRVTSADESRVPPVWRKLVALVSIVLWMSVAAGGRLIMYL